MKLKNTSLYNNNDLKKFVYACSKEFRGGRKLCKDLTVVVKGRYIPRWKKTRYNFETKQEEIIEPKRYPNLSVRGSAYYGKVYHEHGHGYFMNLSIPCDNPNGVDKRDLALTIIHELAHCKKETHNQMRKRKRVYYRQWVGDDKKASEPFQFADGLLLRMKETPAKKTRNIRLERYQKALNKVREYEAKKKRTANLLKKWQNKVKYYEKALN